MFTKNIFKQKDGIADLVGNILEADYKNKMEELKGNQHKIDANKNNKIDADDFKILRGEKKSMKEASEKSTNPFSKDYKSQMQTKPGEKAGFTSKKISTGTVYSRKPPKPEPTKEGVEQEQIDELSRRTLLRYSNKALKSAVKHAIGSTSTRNAGETADKHLDKFNKRGAGIYAAKKRLDREVKEEVEQVYERELTKGETAEKERIVKGMKKSLSGFKARYGDRAKSVMYATATKAAKKG